MDLFELKKLHKDGINITDFLLNKGFPKSEAISISYDLQAGSYTKIVDANTDFTYKYTEEIAEIINHLSSTYLSLMEAGVGEATTLANVYDKLNARNILSLGFDISLSRIFYAQKYFSRGSRGNANLFVGDLFNIPLEDNSVDIVYTSHSIEPNGGLEAEALSELFRVTRKYLIVIEPSYEYATTEGKLRMDRLGYVKDLHKIAEGLGMNVIEYKLKKVCSNKLNPTAILIIEKNRSNIPNNQINFICPHNKSKLLLTNNIYWSSESLNIYPVVSNIPLLTREHGIVATHFSEFI